MAAKYIVGSPPAVISGNYGDPCTYHVKKTGYLVKSPAKIGRWRKRWFKLVDIVMLDPLTSTPMRNVWLEYYTSSPEKLGNKDAAKRKGAINLNSCIAVLGHEKKIKGYNHVLNIVMANIIVHHLVASSEEEKDEWITALNEFIFIKPVYFGEARKFVYTGYLSSKGQLTSSQSVQNLSSEQRRDNLKQALAVHPKDPTTTSASAKNSRDRPRSDTDSVLEEDCELLHSYDYIDDNERCTYRTRHTSETRRTSDSNSDPDYWNDDPAIENRLQASSWRRRKSCSYDDIEQLKSSKLYVLKLPKATLNTRWSLSSVEDEESEIFQTVTISSSLTHICGETNVYPPEYHQYITQNSDKDMYLPEAQKSKKINNPFQQPATIQPTKITKICIRRTSSTPSTLSQDLQDSKLYSNRDAILAHMDILRCSPSSVRDESSSSSAAEESGEVHRPVKLQYSEPPVTTTPDLFWEQSPKPADDTLNHNLEGLEDTLSHSYNNLEGQGLNNIERQTSESLQISGKMPNATEYDTDLDGLTAQAESVCSPPSTDTLFMTSEWNIDDQAMLHKLNTSSSTSGNAPSESEDALYCNPATLKSDSIKGTDEEGNQYYNMPKLRRSFTDPLSDIESPSSIRPRDRVVSIPVKTNKKPIPPVRKRRVGTVQCESNLPQELSKSSNFVTRQQEASSIMAKPKSSPPVKPRKCKNAAKTVEDRSSAKTVEEREKVRSQLTKVFSVPSNGVGSFAQPQSLVTETNQSTEMPVSVKKISRENLYLPVAQP